MLVHMVAVFKYKWLAEFSPVTETFTKVKLQVFSNVEMLEILQTPNRFLFICKQSSSILQSLAHVMISHIREHSIHTRITFWDTDSFRVFHPCYNAIQKRKTSKCQCYENIIS